MQKLCMSVLISMCLIVGPAIGYAQFPSERETVVWTEGAENCAKQFKNGIPLKITAWKDVIVVVALLDTGWKIRADVFVHNKSEDAVDIFPETVSLNMTAPKQKALAYQSPQQLAKSINRKAFLQGLASGLGAAADSVNGSDAYGRGEEEGQAARVDADAAIIFLDRIALKANTINSGEQIFGCVFFEREKNMTSAVLRVPVGDYIFQFPFGR